MAKVEKEKYVSIQERWREVDWDLIQRMRFMNADAEIDPEDSFHGKKKTVKESLKRMNKDLGRKICAFWIFVINGCLQIIQTKTTATFGH